MRPLLLALVLVLGATLAIGVTATQAADTQDAVAVDVAPQADDAGDDTRTWVMGWTVLAAVGAAAVGLLAMMLRVVMGWVKPPPELDEGH